MNGSFSTALQTAAWLIWRDFIFDDQNVDDRETYVKRQSSNLYGWLIGTDAPPTDYSACYEQVCDFALVGVRFQTIPLMQEIIAYLESNDTPRSYEIRIQSLLNQFGLEDTPHFRMNMEHVYAASICYAKYLAKAAAPLIATMDTGGMIVDREYVQLIKAVTDLQTNVIQHASLPETSDALQKKETDSPHQQSRQFREAQLKRKSTRKNLSMVEESMILFQKEQEEKRLKKRKRTPMNFLKKDKKNRSENIVRSRSNSGWARGTPSATDGQTKRRRETTSNLGSKTAKFIPRGFSLDQGSAGIKATQEEEDRSACDAADDDVEESESEKKARMQHVAHDFVRSACSFLTKEGRIGGMSAFLASYKLPSATIATSPEVRREMIIHALGDHAAKNFIVAIIVPICKNGAVDDFVAKIRTDVIKSDVAWTEECDRLTTMAALYASCGLGFYIRSGYLAANFTKSLSLVASNPEFVALNGAMMAAYKLYDDAMADLRAVHRKKDVSNVQRSRSDSQVVAWHTADQEGDGDYALSDGASERHM